MELKEKKTDRELTVSLKGELDHHAATAGMAALENSVERALPLSLILDFSGVTFMDSSGIALVLRTNRRMRELGGSMRLRHVPQ
jgi:stage II sporulation protein AA (anti-sigma F factor antagonist)